MIGCGSPPGTSTRCDPHRPGRGAPPASRGRRPGPSGDQGTRGPTPADGAPLAGLRSRLRGRQPVERRRDPEPGRDRDVEVGFPGMPGFGDPVAAEARASARPAAAYACGRSTSPTAARSTTPTTSTSPTGWPEKTRTAAQPWLGHPTAPWSATGTSRQGRGRLRHPGFATSTHVTPPERAAFQRFLDSGYVDLVRPHVSGPDGFTYWDYYRQRFERNRGMLGIDFLLGSPGLAERVSHAFVDREERGGEGHLRPRARWWSTSTDRRGGAAPTAGPRAPALPWRSELARPSGRRTTNRPPRWWPSASRSRSPSSSSRSALSSRCRRRSSTSRRHGLPRRRLAGPATKTLRVGVLRR